jgi:hypothetical protein
MAPAAPQTMRTAGSFAAHSGDGDQSFRLIAPVTFVIILSSGTG